MSKNLSNVLKGTYTTNTLPLYVGNTSNVLVNAGSGWFSSEIKTINNTTIIGSGNISTNLVGSNTAANFTRFPNSLFVVSNTAIGIQQNEPHNIGIIGEGVANSSNSSIYGIGVYGVGYTNGVTRSGGIVGEGHVSASGDSGSAIGVRGYSNDVHSGGMNIGLYADANNSSINNYALYMNSGNITNVGAQSWVLGGNLSFTGAYSVTIPTLSLTNPLSVSNGGTGATSLATANVAVTIANNTFTGTQTFTGSSSILSSVFTNMVETVTVSATAATGTIAYYTGTQSVLYYTTNAAANWTVNLTHSSGTTLNNAMAIGQAVTVAFAVTQGSPAFYNSAVQVDGSAVTPKWQGGTAPTAGNTSSVDVYTYTVIKTGAATFTVLASLTKFA